MSCDNLSVQLKKLSFTFYSFHLRNNINYGSNTVPEASQLWEQLIDLGNTLNITELKTLKSQLICYENNQYKPELEDRVTNEYFSLLHHQLDGLDLTIPVLNGLKFNGFLSPYRLHDSYAIDLTLTPENLLTPNQLQLLNLSSYLQPSLGKTLLLYANPTVSLEDYLTLANTCINQLFSQNNNLELTAQGSLLNCPIFAYDNGETDPSKHHHIIIWFNPNSNIPEQIDKANEYLLYILWSRHKILYAYHQSRICVNKDNIQKRHTEIEGDIKKFSQIAQSDNRLQQFKQLLTQLPQQSLEYSQLLRELSDHQNTIKANEQNYRNLISKLEKLPDSDSNFVQPFLNQVNNKFQPQIETDLSFFSPANSLFEELINNIRGIVAIDQIESDRLFQKQLRKREEKFEIALQTRNEEFDKILQQQNQQWLQELREQDEKSAERDKETERWIAFFGTALAVSGVSAGVINEPGKTIVKTLSINPPSFCEISELAKFSCTSSFDVFFHLIVGIIPAALIFCGMKR